jgi:hypothetical protein
MKSKMTSKEIVQRLRFPPEGLDPSVIMFTAAEEIERLERMLKHRTKP